MQLVDRMGKSDTSSHRRFWEHGQFPALDWGRFDDWGRFEGKV